MERKPTVIVLIAILAIILAATYLQLRPTRVKIDRAPIIGSAIGLGEVMAQQTVEAVHDSGRVVVVTDYDHDKEDRGRDYLWETFHAELKKHPGIKIAATQVVEHDPNEDNERGCPSSAFREILERHADANVVVFFIDLPAWNGVGDFVPKPPPFKIIALSTLRLPTKSYFQGYFDSGLLWAVMGRTASPVEPTAGKTRTPREWFDIYYQLYTQQNAESLPD